MRLVKWGLLLVAMALCLSTSAIGEEVVNGNDLLGETRYSLVGLAGKCLDVEGIATTDGTPVNLFRCNGGDNQLWRLDLNGIAQRIMSIGDKCLIPDFNHPSGDIRVVIGACGGGNDLWRLATPGVERPSRLIHDATGLCLDVEGAIAADGTPTQLFGCHGDANQIWRPTPEVCTPNASGQCLNRYAWVGLAGKCLDVEGASTADGTPVNLFRCHGGDNQRWRLGLTGAPQKIVGLGGKCLTPDFGHPSGDIRVAIGECGDGEDIWRLETPGYSRPSRLIHTSTGMCLDVEAAATADGTPTQLFECHDDANQLWRPAPEVCTQDSQGLCLNQDRFRVDLRWRSFDGTTGSGQVVPVGSDDSGLLWFFEADNWEMLIKVLDGCTHNDRLWVFAAATTTVEYTLTVTDTEVGAIREYFNPLGNAAAAITDTGAFATCPAGSASQPIADDVPVTGKVRVRSGPPSSAEGHRCVGSYRPTIRGAERILRSNLDPDVSEQWSIRGRSHLASLRRHHRIRAGGA